MRLFSWSGAKFWNFFLVGISLSVSGCNKLEGTATPGDGVATRDSSGASDPILPAPVSNSDAAPQDSDPVSDPVIEAPASGSGTGSMTPVDSQVKDPAQELGVKDGAYADLGDECHVLESGIKSLGEIQAASERKGAMVLKGRVFFIPLRFADSKCTQLIVPDPASYEGTESYSVKLIEEQSTEAGGVVYLVSVVELGLELKISPVESTAVSPATTLDGFWAVKPCEALDSLVMEGAKAQSLREAIFLEGDRFLHLKLGFLSPDCSNPILPALDELRLKLAEGGMAIFETLPLDNPKEGQFNLRVEGGTMILIEPVLLLQDQRKSLDRFWVNVESSCGKAEGWTLDGESVNSIQKGFLVQDGKAFDMEFGFSDAECQQPVIPSEEGVQKVVDSSTGYEVKDVVPFVLQDGEVSKFQIDAVMYFSSGLKFQLRHLVSSDMLFQQKAMQSRSLGEDAAVAQ